jgi:hypothetical protein
VPSCRDRRTAHEPTPPRPPQSVAEAFFRQGFGCLGAVVVKIALIVVVVLVLDWRSRQKRQRIEAERAQASEAAARLADRFGEEKDADGRFVRRLEGELPEADFWGRPFRLGYKPGTLSDGLEVRSAGPDGEWNTRDDVVVTRSSRIANKALARDAAGGLIDAARDRLIGKGKADPEQK